MQMFRLWDKIFDQMVTELPYDYAIDLDGDVCVIERKNVLRKVDTMTLIRSTGLLDKNGVEIYESDVVDYENGDEISTATVEFQRGRFVLMHLERLGCHEIGGHWPIEVIGNIYQNKDLLG